MKRITLTNLSGVSTMSRNELAAAQGGGLFDKVKDVLKTLNKVRQLGCAAVKTHFPSLTKNKVYKTLCPGA